MNCVEFGKENRETVILLHGGGLSWWNYREAAEELASDYRVILPILDGHAGSHSDFTSIEDNAERIIAFIDRELGGSVAMMGGLSLGGQILLEILARRGDICRRALIESALVMPSRLTRALIKPTFGCSYGLIKQKWFARLQFSYLRIKKELFEDYYADTCAVSKANMIAFLQANCAYSAKDGLSDCRAKAYIFVGEKENGAMRRSAEIISERLTGSVLSVLPQMHHGEFSINHAREYAAKLREIISGSE